MHVPTWAKLASAAALVVTALPSVAAVAAPEPAVPTEHPVLAPGTPSAEQALAAVKAAFDRRTPRGALAPTSADPHALTLAMRDLSLQLDELSPADRAAARSYLARPTDSPDPDGTTYGQTAKPTSDCAKTPAQASSHFCITYATATNDAPSLTDTDGDGVPDQVEETRAVMDNVWNRVITQGGYLQPPSDINRSNHGPDARYDVYLADIGGDGLYGYCVPESSVPGQGFNSYCVLDNDYRPAQFGQHTALENLQVTGAHEFFHAVQFRYDAREDSWFMENTATWLEDEIYDGINDNRQYLADSSLRSPARPLDEPNFRYGNWIWWRYLTEHFPTRVGGLPVLVRDVWEHAAEPGVYSMKAGAMVLDDLGTSIVKQLAHFGVANRRPASHYEEGDSYRGSALTRSWRLRPGHRNVGLQDVKPWHMSNRTYGLVPRSGYANRKWRLKVSVALPGKAAGPYAQLTVFPVSGEPTTKVIHLKSDGTGTARVGFSSRAVRRVELTLTNGGHRYNCGRGYAYSCDGYPLDAFRHYKFRATTLRAR